MIAAFIKWLEASGLAEFDVLDEGDRGFRSRFLIQKHACIAKAAGMPLPHNHEVYMDGPFSSSLEGEYGRIAEDRGRLYDPVAPALPAGFDGQRYLEMVRGKSDDWLETAACLIDREPETADREDLLDMVGHVQKGCCSRDFVSGVLSDLEAAGVLGARAHWGDGRSPLPRWRAREEASIRAAAEAAS